MGLLTTLLASNAGSGSSSVPGTILSPVICASTAALTAVYANGSSGLGATLTNGASTLTAARVATTAALTVTYANGASGVGATLTNAGAQAAISIDSVTLSASDRVLVKNQAAPAQNGVYSVTDIGSGATNWVLTRVTDFDQAAEMLIGTNISITAGTVNTGTAWILSASVATVGTDAATFAATAAISLDGVSPTAGQRVLIKDQASTLQNGVYTVTTVGSASSLWVLTRSTDFDQAAEMSAGVQIDVASGTANAATIWVLTASVAAVGTNAVSFSQVGAASSTPTFTSATIGNLNIAANTISSTNAGGDIILTPMTTGQVEIGANATKASRLRFREDTDNGTNYVTLGAPSSLAGDSDYTLPSAVPGSNDLVTVCSTAGLFSFGNVTGTAAVQADMETGTSLVVPVVPGVQQFHPSAAKLWAHIDGAAATVNSSYNVTSAADTGTGRVTVTIATDFSSANYVIVAIGANNLGGGTFMSLENTNSSTGASFEVDNYVSTAVAVDPISYRIAGYGDQ